MEEELCRDMFAQCLIQWAPGFWILLYYKEQTRSITTLQSLYFRIIVQTVVIKPVVKWDFSLVLHMCNLKLNPQISQKKYSCRGSRWSEFRGQIVSGRKSRLWGFLCFTHTYLQPIQLQTCLSLANDCLPLLSPSLTHGFFLLIQTTAAQQVAYNTNASVTQALSVLYLFSSVPACGLHHWEQRFY